jgi:hypothetical protein
VQKVVCSWWSEVVSACLARVWQCAGKQSVCRMAFAGGLCAREALAVSSEQLVHNSAVLGWGLTHITAQESSMQQQCLCRCL